MEIRNVERQSATKYKVTTYEEYHIRYGDELCEVQKL